MIYLETQSTDPAYNLAAEQYAFDSLPRSESYCMLWQNNNAVIIGKHQNTMEEINAEYVRLHGVRVVRRLSGGGAVYHDLGNLNFTFIQDAGGLDTLDLHRFCQPVVRALREWGVPVTADGRNDLLIGGRKISGNAQYLKDGRIMHHGTLLFDSDLAKAEAALRVSGDKIASKGVSSVRQRMTTIKAHMPHGADMTARDFWDLLRAQLTVALNLRPGSFDRRAVRQIEALRASRYAAWDWNYGRSPRYAVRKERRVDGVGKVQLDMEVDGGRIKAVAIHGDYFGAGETSTLEEALCGCAAEPEALSRVLRPLPVGRIIHGLRPEELIRILLE